MKKQRLLILGTRGIPERHGKLETLAERLAIYMTQRGWRVTVYCQTDEDKLYYSIWQGINLVHIPVPKNDSFWSILFDFKAAFHAVQQEGLILTLGCNTSVFSLLYRLKNRANITKINGVKWWQRKWNALEKSWLYNNQQCAAWYSNHLITNHPQVESYLRNEVKTDKPISVIPDCTPAITQADENLLKDYSLTPKQYGLVIAQPESEKSVGEIVSAFSQRKRDIQLVVLGKYSTKSSNYYKRIVESASDEVMFVGEIEDRQVVESLQYYSCLYFHGHQVGETDISLIEAMSTGSPILAHNNKFNSWVAKEGAVYFEDAPDCDRQITELLENKRQLHRMSQSSLDRYYAVLADDRDLEAYQNLFLSFVDSNHSSLK